MNSISPVVGLVVINWNGIEMTNRLLESLQTIDQTILRIFIIDNASAHEEGQRIMKKWKGRVELIQNDQNLGFAKAANQGIIQALNQKCHYVLLMNNDTIAQKDFLDELIHVANTDDRIAILSPLVLSIESPREVQSAGGRISYSKARATPFGQGISIEQFQNLPPFEMDYVSGACVLIRSDALNKIGLLHEDYFAYFEETELCHRARKSGMKVIVVPKAIIWHHSDSPSSKGSLVKYRLLMRNRVLFLLRNGSTTQALRFFFFSFSFELISSTFYMVKRGWKLSTSINTLFSAVISGIISYLKKGRSITTR